MKTIITEFEKKIDANDIFSIEQEYNITIPENLKKLYLKYNGGIIEKFEEEYDFFSIKHGVLKIEDSLKSLQIDEQIISNDYLPIANSPVGHILTVYLANDDKKGKIFLFRHDDLEPILMSDSLEGFLNVESIDDL